MSYERGNPVFARACCAVIVQAQEPSRTRTERVMKEKKNAHTGAVPYMDTWLIRNCPPLGPPWDRKHSSSIGS